MKAHSPTRLITIQENSKCLVYDIAPIRSFISFPIVSNEFQSFDDPRQLLTEREDQLVQTINEISGVSESTGQLVGRKCFTSGERKIAKSLMSSVALGENM
jgi:hypothetical protein